MFISKNSKFHKALSFIEKPILYLTVILIIIEGPSVYAYAQFGFYWLVNTFRIIIAILLILLIVINVFRTEITKLLIKRWLILCAAYFFIVLLELLATFKIIGVMGYVYFFCVVLPLFFTYIYLKIYNKEGYVYLYALSDVVFVIAIISLFFWLFGSILGIITTNESLTVQFGNPFEAPSYLGIYFEHQTVNVFGIENVIRNQGIFCEAPLYVTYLALALGVEVYIRPWRKEIKNRTPFIQHVRPLNIFKVIILMITLVTTLTTSGYVIAIILLVSLFYSYPINRKYAFKLKLIIGIILLVCAIACALYIIIDKADSMSFRIRVDDYMACFKAWLTSPIFGVGAMNTEPIVSFMSDFRSSNYGLSAGLGNILAQGGILLFAVYIIPFIYWFVAALKNKNFGMACMPIIFMMVFALTVIEYSTLTMSMIAIGYANIIIPNNYSLLHYPKSNKDKQLV